MEAKVTTKTLISKIRGHPRFKDLITDMDLQEFIGAEVIVNDPSISSYIKREQRQYFVSVWERINSA